MSVAVGSGVVVGPAGGDTYIPDGQWIRRTCQSKERVNINHPVRAGDRLRTTVYTLSCDESVQPKIGLGAEPCVGNATFTLPFASQFVITGLVPLIIDGEIGTDTTRL